MYVHPNAHLSTRRNTRVGLLARTKILSALENKEDSIREVSLEINVSYSRILHHLHLLEEEHLVKRLGEKRPFKWRVTGLGQQPLAYKN